MSYMGFDEIEPNDKNWGAKEKKIKQDIIATIVSDCIAAEKDLTGHKHSRIYNGYGTSTIFESSADYDIRIGNLKGSSIDSIIKSNEEYAFVARTLPDNVEYLKIDTLTNTINIGNGTTTVSVNGTPI